jgi:hypothetical protein
VLWVFLTSFLVDIGPQMSTQWRNENILSHHLGGGKNAWKNAAGVVLRRFEAASQ